MGKYFDYFPLVQYDINRKKLSEYQTVTNIFFRMAFVREILNNTAAYSEYSIRDGDTPEIIAEKIYGNAEAHWIILLANNIVDPYYDWPLTSMKFNKYMQKKYRRAFADANPNERATLRNIIAWSKLTPIRYEKVVTYLDVDSGVITERAFEINKEPLTTTNLDGYDTYEANTSLNVVETTLPESSFRQYDVNGKTVEETITSRAVSIFDHEIAENEKKRAIKIIQPAYYPQIKAEFDRLNGRYTTSTTFVRTLGE